MGCLFSKSNEQGPRGDAKPKDVANTPDPNSITDPRIPLTVRQKFSIGKSWKGITRALEETGVNMFVKLFNETPEIMSVFVKFENLKNKDNETWRTSEELREHATMVMSTLDQAISSIDDPDEFCSFLETVGKTHQKIPGFKKEFFWKIEKPFLDAVKETLEDRYTENIESIYKITIKCILETMARGYEGTRS